MCAIAPTSLLTPKKATVYNRVILLSFSWQANESTDNEGGKSSHIPYILYWTSLIITSDPEYFCGKKGNGKEVEDGKDERGCAFSESFPGLLRRFSVPMPNNPDRITPLFHQFSFYLRCSLQSTGGKQIRLLSNLFLEVERLRVGAGVGGNGRALPGIQRSTAGRLTVHVCALILSVTVTVWPWMEKYED